MKSFVAVRAAIGAAGILAMTAGAWKMSSRFSFAAVDSQRGADSDFVGNWESIGPAPNMRYAFNRAPGPKAPFSGRISSIAVDPTDENHWLLGVGGGGVWESRDAGQSWIPITDSAPTLATGDVTFDPTNPRTIYVGTGEARGGNLTRGGVGILKSTDGGQNWTVLGASSFARGAVKRLRINPANPNELVAASTRGGFGRGQENPSGPPPYGVLKSTDGGETWTRTLAGQATGLEVHAGDYTRQYAAIGEHVSGQGAGVVTNGLYRSTDAGQEWTVVTGPWGASLPTQLTMGRIEIALAPSNPNVLYVSISQQDGNRIRGLYRTDNAWDEAPVWRQISTASTTGVFSGVAPGTYCVGCNFSHVLTVNPNDPEMIFAGGKESLWRCRNCSGAPQWTNVSNNGRMDLFADQQAAAWAGTRLILGNDGGLFSTPDLGANWQNHNASLPTVMLYGGALHPNDPNFILAGGRDHGATLMTGALLAWSAVPAPQNAVELGGEGEVAISSMNPETHWMLASVGGEIWRTLDGGRTAVRVDNGIDRSAGYPYPAAVRKCPTNDNVFLTGNNRLWRTDNFFDAVLPSWRVNGFSGAVLTSQTYAITFDRKDESCGTYAYGVGSQILLTRDAGATWVDLNPSRTVLPALQVNSIAFDPVDPGTMYLAFSNFIPGSPRPRHIFKTTNALSVSPVWLNISPAEDVPFNVIEIDPRNGALIYAGSDTGLWVSGDAGATWQKARPDRGLPPAAILDIKINPTTDQTIVFTHGRGAYRRTGS